MRLLFFALFPMLPFSPVTGAEIGSISHFDVYTFKLELNRNQKVCGHMERVYNKHFRVPWDYRQQTMEGVFPKVPYVETNRVLENYPRYSAYPRTPEFDVIAWREGRMFFASSRTQLDPTLLAEVDIDNDGQLDAVVKTQFALSITPGGGSSPGGEDHLWIFKPGTFDVSKPLGIEQLYAARGQDAPRQLSYVTLRYTDEDRPAALARDHELMAATIIRPFILGGKTYLSVYVQWAVNDSKRRREWMWVMQYTGGGRNLGKGEWEPADVNKLCKFRMLPIKTVN
jgi:hypothetical protein